MIENKLTIETLHSFQNYPIWDGALIPNAITFEAILAEDPLTVQEAPAEQGLAALQDWGGGFPGLARGRWRGTRLSQAVALRENARTRFQKRYSEFPRVRSWNWGFICRSGLAFGQRVALDHKKLTLLLELIYKQKQTQNVSAYFFPLILANTNCW